MKKQSTLNEKVSLATRLERLEQNLPSDDAYGSYVASILRQLLKTPLEKLCEGDPTALKALNHELSIARNMLKSDSRDPPRTYLDAIKTVYDLALENKVSPYVTPNLPSEARNQCLKVMTHLARQLLAFQERIPVREKEVKPRSLKERLLYVNSLPDDEDASENKSSPYWYKTLPRKIRAAEYPILMVPLAHYFYAASILDGSEAPIQLCNEFFAQRKSDRSLYLAYWVKLSLGDIKSYHNDCYVDLYNLLVEPIFPGKNERFEIDNYEIIYDEPIT